MLQRLLTALLVMVSCLLGGTMAFAQGRVVTIDPAFLRGTIQLQIGDTLQVVLKANAGPGYAWQITENNPALLQSLGVPQAQARGTIPYQVMRFRAVRVGVLRLTMVYQNPKLKIAPKNTFRATIAIDLSMAPRKVIVTENDHGKAVIVSVGEILSVKLPVNAGMGFRWVPFGNLNIALKPIRTFTQNPGNEFPKGYLYQVFHYQALSPGILQPTFNLQNSARLLQKTFSVMVTIQSPARNVPLPTQNAPLPITPMKSAASVVLQDQDSASNRTVRVEETLIVRLTSNPTTGYTWEVEPGLENILQRTSGPDFEQTSTQRVGASGVQVFRFKMLREGMGILRLLYRRPFEKGVVAARKWEVNLTVTR